jgi:hypothetical protein
MHDDHLVDMAGNVMQCTRNEIHTKGTPRPNVDRGMATISSEHLTRQMSNRRPSQRKAGAVRDSGGDELRGTAARPYAPSRGRGLLASRLLRVAERCRCGVIYCTVSTGSCGKMRELTFLW